MLERNLKKRRERERERENVHKILCNFVRTKVFVENCIFYYLYRERDFYLSSLFYSFLLLDTNSVPWVRFCGMQTSPWPTIHAKQLTFLTAAKVFQETGKRRDTPHCKKYKIGITLQ